MKRFLKRFSCWMLAHDYEPAKLFTSMGGGGVPAERCRACGDVRPAIRGLRVVSW